MKTYDSVMSLWTPFKHDNNNNNKLRYIWYQIYINIFLVF